jgi:hypothetical protein
MLLMQYLGRDFPDPSAQKSILIFGMNFLRSCFACILWNSLCINSYVFKGLLGHKNSFLTDNTTIQKGINICCEGCSWSAHVVFTFEQPRNELSHEDNFYAMFAQSEESEIWGWSCPSVHLSLCMFHLWNFCMEIDGSISLGGRSTLKDDGRIVVSTLVSVCTV